MWHHISHAPFKADFSWTKEGLGRACVWGNGKENTVQLQIKSHRAFTILPNEGMGNGRQSNQDLETDARGSKGQSPSKQSPCEELMNGIR